MGGQANYPKEESMIKIVQAKEENSRIQGSHAATSNSVVSFSSAQAQKQMTTQALLSNMIPPGSSTNRFSNQKQHMDDKENDDNPYNIPQAKNLQMNSLFTDNESIPFSQ